MDGFKKLPKMQSFKTGGFVKRKEATVPKVPTEKVAKDTKLTNKKTPTGFVAEDKEAKLDVSTLKKGGRAKKATGTVKKFKKGGEVTNVYEAKKSSGDKDNIKKVKDQKPTKADAPSKASTKKAKETINKCSGGKIKKMADGGAAALTQQATAALPTAQTTAGMPAQGNSRLTQMPAEKQPMMSFEDYSQGYNGVPTSMMPPNFLNDRYQEYVNMYQNPGPNLGKPMVKDFGTGNGPFGGVPPKSPFMDDFGDRGGRNQFDPRRFNRLQEKMNRFQQRGREIPRHLQQRYDRMAALQPKPQDLIGQQKPFFDPPAPQVQQPAPQVQQPEPQVQQPAAPSWTTEAPSWYNQAPSWYNQAPAQTTSAAPTPEPALPSNAPVEQPAVQTQASGNLATMKRGGKC